jgi:hypothetical protein
MPSDSILHRVDGIGRFSDLLSLMSGESLAGVTLFQRRFDDESSFDRELVAYGQIFSTLSVLISGESSARVTLGFKDT